MRCIKKPRKSRIQPIGMLKFNGDSFSQEQIDDFRRKWNEVMISSNVKYLLINDPQAEITFIRNKQEPRFIAHFKAVKKLRLKHNCGRIRINEEFLMVDKFGHNVISSMLLDFEIKNVYKEKEHEIIFVCLNKHFDPIPEASLIPFYEILFQTSAEGITKIIEVKKLKYEK